MKLYELSKQYQWTNKKMIDLLRSLSEEKKNTKKNVVEKSVGKSVEESVEESKKRTWNSFSVLSEEDVLEVRKYFEKGRKPKKSPKKSEKKSPVSSVISSVIIVKKAEKHSLQQEEKANETEKQKPERPMSNKEDILKDTPEATPVIKKILRVPKKVVVRKKKVFSDSSSVSSVSASSSPLSHVDGTKISSSSSSSSSKEEKRVVGTERKEGYFRKQVLPKTGETEKRGVEKVQKEVVGNDSDSSVVVSKERSDGRWKKGDRKSEDRKWDKRDKEESKELFFRKRKNKELKIPVVPKSIEIMESIKLSELAKKLNVKSNELIAKLMKMGVMATINEILDSETAVLLCTEYGCEAKIVSLYEETLIEETSEGSEEDMELRSPVVTVMGHVDHGKTLLLDAIRMSDLVGKESGGITQHIGAYRVNWKEKHPIVFLDTPGHEAFSSMRARGAKVTDIVVLVVAADDGVMPQTKEAYHHAREADVPILVAINKIDSPKANVERVKNQLSELGLVSEEWGGKTIVVEVSALKRWNLDELIESILLESEILELKTNPKRKASGTIIESRVDIGRGPVATLLVQSGTLRVGNYFVAGVYSGKVRALLNEWGKSFELALPSTPVEVLGLDGVPKAGDPFNVVSDERTARQIAQKRQELNRLSQVKERKQVTLEDLSKQIQEKEIQELKIVLKGDVQGSVEALAHALEGLGNEEVSVRVIHRSTGAINENDVMLASASKALILGFHVHPSRKSSLVAQRESVQIIRHSIIYDALNHVKALLEGMLSPNLLEEVTGQAEVREIFRLHKLGVVAGSYVSSGRIVRNSRVRVIRDGVEVHEGDIESLRRFKDNVEEVKESLECGIVLQKFRDLKEGDIIEGFLVKEVAKTLS